MAELRLAGNYINATGGYGHLQIVYVNGDTQLEIEVQAPWNVTFGTWQFPALPRDHSTNTPNYSFDETDYYEYVTLELGERTADDVWDVLVQIHTAFQQSGASISYDLYKNSNSYATTVLSIVGIDINSYLSSLLTGEISEYPGAGVNVLEIPEDAISMNLHGTSGTDIIVTGLGEDILAGESALDVLSGGGGADVLVGGSLADGFSVEDLQDETYLTSYHSEWNDGSRDELSAGVGSDIILSTSDFWEDVSLLYGETTENLKAAVDSVDFIDGSDTDFTAYFQAAHPAGGLGAIFILTAELLANAPYDLESGQFDFGTLLMGDSEVPVWGILVEDPQMGTSILIMSSNGYRSHIALGGVYNLNLTIDPAATIWQLSPSGNRPGTPGDDYQRAGGGDDIFTASDGNDTYIGGAGFDMVDFSATTSGVTVSLDSDATWGEAFSDETGEDVLWQIEGVVGGSGNDIIAGSGVANTLIGGDGNDALTGGLDDDSLSGGWGSDTYVYASGDGHDTIEDWNDSASVDALNLGSGIDRNQVSVTRGTTGFWDIILNFGTTGSVTIRGGFYTENTVIEQVNFADGTVWSLTDLRQRFLAQAATSGNDEIYGFVEDDVIHGGAGADSIDGLSGNDSLSGEAGDDVLIGEVGNDTLIGGAGADTLVGNVGNDTYVYASGDGYDYLNDGSNSSSDVDVLRLTGLNESDVDFMRSGLSLILTVQATGETIFVNNQFSTDQGGYWGIERIEFADGSAWEHQRISDIGWIRGTAGNDNLVGTWRQEILAGGAGDDSLTGDWGNDTYLFNSGDGNDTIHDWGNPEATDVLQLGAGIEAGSVAVGRSTAGFWDIVLNFGTAGSVTVADGFYGAATVIEEVRFADDTVLTLDDLQTMHLQQAVTAGADTIFGFIDRDDVIEGGGGNDSLTGFSGNDTLQGGAGDDSLSGDDGNDILIGGAGNDSMAGGAGNDAFVFRPGFGLDTIADFTAGPGTDDVLEFGNTLFADFEAVLAAASQVGSDTVIAFDAANTVTLKNVTLANLHADDVRFVA